jgi:hypothetical protein
MASERFVTGEASRPAVEPPRCCNCNRTLKDPSEWVRSAKKTMCLDCYEALFNPYLKCCNGGELG